MALLTDTDIERMLCVTESWGDKQNTLHVHPYNERCLTPIGYDARVGSPYSCSSKAGPVALHEGHKIVIKAGDTALITTLEKFSMPRNRMVSALICSKVSKVSQGLSHISTTIDPDWDGPLLIALRNNSNSRIELAYGDPFCTIVFFENKSSSTRDCERVPGRLDIFMKDWARKAKKRKKLNYVKMVLPPALIAISFPVGYYYFGNTPGLAATITGGVAISHLLKSYLDQS